MRALLDESLPRDLARHLPGHDVRTVQRQGWAGLKNGELLRAARDAEVAVLVTADRNVEHQQSIARSGLALVVLRARSTRIIDLLPPVPRLLEVLPEQRPGRSLTSLADVALQLTSEQASGSCRPPVSRPSRLVAAPVWIRS